MKHRSRTSLARARDRRAARHIAGVAARNDRAFASFSLKLPTAFDVVELGRSIQAAWVEASKSIGGAFHEMQVGSLAAAKIQQGLVVMRLGLAEGSAVVR